ncbi:MAG: DUF896 domain-containing protein [Anaerofustis stercorihominis]|nr:DUF896 domain-containing protein [Anaerofustis stercorihominis]
MLKEKIERINELARKKKTVGLTPEELEEQAVLRKEYIEMWRGNVINVVESVVIVDEDGNRRKINKKK